MNKTTMSSLSAEPSYRSVAVEGNNLQTAPESGELSLVGSSAAIRRVRTQIERIAPHFRCALIRGDRGTGKKLVARLLHAKRGMGGDTFLLLDAEIIEACRRGNAAVGRYPEGAEQGTLFLDDVDRLSLPAQDWLVEMLRWKDAPRRSKNTQPGVEMRVIASTTEDLRPLASAGRFRHALYQRLVTVEIALPPLRERMEDIPELARHLVERVARLHGRSMLGIAEESMMQLQKHCWPGNVRELCDVIQGGVVRSNSGFIEARHLVFARSTGTERLSADMDASVRLEDVVERHVFGVLKECGGNKLRAAEMLGISRSTLYRMLEAGGSEAVLR